MLYDITLPMQSGLANWPEDTVYAHTFNLRMCEGAIINLSSVQLSVHCGTHADAPFHYRNEGATMEQVSPEIYLGPVHVVDVQGKETIAVSDLVGLDFSNTPRLFLKTNSWQDFTRFPERIPLMAEDVPAFLGAQGVFLIGLDVPSVDALDSKDLPLHHALDAQGIFILECLALAEAPPGRYELIALPLKIVGSDGAPVRALLRSYEL